MYSTVLYTTVHYTIQLYTNYFGHSYDLHRNSGTDKSISGLARLAGACDSYNSCVLVEGHDFTGSFVAAHELGHGFGMRHDEPYCSSTYLMSGLLGPGKVTWSTCSMADMQKYIDKLEWAEFLFFDMMSKD